MSKRHPQWGFVVFAALAALLAGCSALLPQPPAAPEAAPDLSWQRSETVSRGICLDPSTSAGEIAPQVRDQIAEVVRSRVTAGGDKAQDSPMVAGLDLTIRLVTTDPYGTEQANLTVTVPGVDQIPPRPDLTAPGVIDPGGPYEQWKAASDTATAQRKQAQEAARKASDRIAALGLPDQYLSGITGCLAALREVQGGTGDLLIASDLDENVTAVAVRSLKGRHVTVIQACPDGDAAACRSRADDFKAWLTDAGATVTFTRPETSKATLRAFLG